MLIYAFLTAIVTLLGSVVLLGFGLVGRRVNDHVVCGKCRFDLEGVYPGAGGSGGAVRCPECGRELAGDRCVKRGVRERWRGGLLGGGVCFAVFIGAGALVANQLRQQGFNVYQHKPVWLLVLEGEGPWPTVANAALSELVDRQTNGELGGEPEAAVIQRALAYQGDTDRVWRTGWGSLIENAIAGGRLSEADTERYARQAVVVTVAARERVRLGDPLPAELHVERRMAEQPILWFTIINEGALLGDDPMRGVIRFGHMINGYGGWGSGYFASGPQIDKMNLFASSDRRSVSGPVGIHDLATRWVVFVGIDAGTGPTSNTYGSSSPQTIGTWTWHRVVEAIEWSDEPDWASSPVDDAEVARVLAAQSDHVSMRLRNTFDELANRLAGWRVEQRAPVEIVARDADTVQLVRDGPEILAVEALLRELSPIEVGAAPGSSGTKLGFWTYFTARTPIPMVFDVIVRDGSTEHQIGTLVADIERDEPVVRLPRSLFTLGPTVWIGAPLPRGFKATTVDLIFRPNPDAARRTIGIDRIAGREFVFEAVPVDWKQGGPGPSVP